MIGRGIRDGSQYLPIRQHAAALASRAGPKDYLGQLEALFGDFVQRWRYVRDPLRQELLAISGPAIYGQIMGFSSPPPGRGFGDCDDATVAIGALAESIGLKSRIVTIATPESRQLFSHVFPQVHVPKVGWVSADAVGFPNHPLGWTPPHKRWAVWDTRGNLLCARGSFPPSFRREFRAMRAVDVSGFLGDLPEGERHMSLRGLSFDDFPDYGLESFGMAGTDNTAPEDWATHGLLSFGAYVDSPLPMVGADRLGLMMEYDENDEIGRLPDGSPVVRTKMLEIDPEQLAHIYRTGKPQAHTVALSDDGDVYQWVEGPLGGFFKKLFKRVKKGVRKVASGIRKGARKLIKKLPGGKYLIKVYDKVKRVAMKAVRPLVKILGKIGRKVAPIAALIPGYGPAIAAVLYKAGKITKLLKDFGVVTDEKGRPKFKSGAQAKAFQEALKKSAKAAKRKKTASRVRRRAPEPRRIARGARVYRARLRGYGLGGV